MTIRTSLLGATAGVVAALASVSAATAQERGSGVPVQGLLESQNLRFFGRFELDAAYIDGDDSLFGYDDYSRTELRSARIGLRGDPTDTIGYVLEVLFNEGGDSVFDDYYFYGDGYDGDGGYYYLFGGAGGGDDVDIGDVYLEFRNGQWRTLVGQIREPISLSRQTRSPFQTSMERAAFVQAFGIDRRAGVSVFSNGDNWTFAGGAYGDNVNNPDAFGADESWALAARGTFAPINTGDRVVQVGGSVRWRDIADDGAFFYAAQPNAHLAPATSRSSFTAEEDLFLGLEAAGVFGPLHVSGEYAWLDGDAASDDATFQGAYIEGGFFFTGEQRNLRADQGAFGRVRVISPITEGGRGAFELRGRVDYLDLTDDVDVADVSSFGTEQTTFSLGLNWYLTNNVRFLGEYVYADVEGESVEYVSDGEGGAYAVASDDGDANVVQARFAVDW